jgi:hypothetical protein
LVLRFWFAEVSADRRVRVTAICVLAFEAAAEIAAPVRKRGTPTCTGPDTAHRECGWKRGERRSGTEQTERAGPGFRMAD